MFTREYHAAFKNVLFRTGVSDRLNLLHSVIDWQSHFGMLCWEVMSGLNREEWCAQWGIVPWEKKKDWQQCWILAFPAVKECLMIRGIIQPVLTIAKIEYTTIYYAGYFSIGGKGIGWVKTHELNIPEYYQWLFLVNNIMYDCCYD